MKCAAKQLPIAVTRVAGWISGVVGFQPSKMSSVVFSRIACLDGKTLKCSPLYQPSIVADWGVNKSAGSAMNSSTRLGGPRLMGERYSVWSHGAPNPDGAGKPPPYAAASVDAP